MRLQTSCNEHQPDGIIGSTEPGSVVDVGCGPVPSFSAAAARWATSVTMADYLPQNTAEISKWKTDAAGKLDWSHQLGVVAGLENSSVGVIEDRLRAKMGEIIACDLYRRNPIYPHRRRFAVALSSLCLEFAAVDLDDYAALLKHLATLIEPGGFLVMQGALGNSYYMLGGTRFPSVSLTESAICDSLAEAGLVLEFWDTLSRRCPVADKPADHDGVFFLVARHVCCSADELF